MRTVVLLNWRHLMLRGTISVLFGLAALCFPQTMITALVVLFGAYALLDGLIAIVFSVSAGIGHRAWAVLIEGGLGILVGIISLLWAPITGLILLYLIATWAVVTGVLEIAAMSCGRLCSAIAPNTHSRVLESGQTVSGTPSRARRASSAGSSGARTPWSMRRAPRMSSASAM